MDAAFCQGGQGQYHANQIPSTVPVTVEVLLRATSAAQPQAVSDRVHHLLEERTSLPYTEGPLDIGQSEDPFLAANVQSICLVDTDSDIQLTTLLRWQISAKVHVFQLNEESGEDDDEGEDGVPSYREWVLPNKDFHGMWESLYYDSSIKRRLINYASSALIFSEHRVNPQLISWNRVVLLHGPPGTGKTSLCKALAHKLTIALGHRYRQGQLVEVNAHSLFSKWFSESGKLVSKLFTSIMELVEEEDTLVFVLIDEVESLTSARKAAVSGSEPSDAIRAVNALLTQLDALKRFPNVMVLTTSNITEAIDLAFVDRADIKAYIGHPSLQARYEILRSSVTELGRAGIIAGAAQWQLLPYRDLPLLPLRGAANGTPGNASIAESDMDHDNGQAASAASEQLSKALEAVAGASQGLSGRALRKLPFLAHANNEALPTPCSCGAYLQALKAAAEKEQADRKSLAD